MHHGRADQIVAIKSGLSAFEDPVPAELNFRVRGARVP